jgi:hypothetical protein
MTPAALGGGVGGETSFNRGGEAKVIALTEEGDSGGVLIRIR